MTTSLPQPRIAAGVPEGGRFAVTDRPASTVTLDPTQMGGEPTVIEINEATVARDLQVHGKHDFDDYMEHHHKWILEDTPLDGMDFDDAEKAYEAAKSTVFDAGLGEDVDADELERARAIVTSFDGKVACFNGSSCECPSWEWNSYVEDYEQDLGTLAAKLPDHAWVNDQNEIVDITDANLISSLDQSDDTWYGGGFYIEVADNGDVDVNGADLRRVRREHADLATTLREGGFGEVFDLDTITESLTPQEAAAADAWGSWDTAEAMSTALDTLKAPLGSGPDEDGSRWPYIEARADVFYEILNAGDYDIDDWRGASLDDDDMRSIADHMDEIKVRGPEQYTGRYSDLQLPSPATSLKAASLLSQVESPHHVTGEVEDYIKEHLVEVDDAWTAVIGRYYS